MSLILTLHPQGVLGDSDRRQSQRLGWDLILVSQEPFCGVELFPHLPVEQDTFDVWYVSDVVLSFGSAL